MPIPKPRKGEKKKKFVSRCMGDEVMKKEYPDQEQRGAICYDSYKKKANIMLTNVKLKLKVNKSGITTKKFNGRDHIVAPVVILVEGVHNGYGPGGAIFYPSDVLEEYAPAWNDVPVVINHPQDIDGDFVSCKENLDVLQTSIGRLYNNEFDTNKIKGNLWLDIEKTNKADKSLAQGIINMDEIEVSTGLKMKIKQESGTWNDEDYDAIALNMMPDHLAILPDSIGACSYDDGCGIRVNKEGGEKVMYKEWVKRIIGLKKKDDSVFEMLDKISQALRAEVKGINTYQYLVDVFDKYIIYEKGGDGQEYKLYKRNYKVVDNEIELSDDITEVTVEKTYKEVKNMEAKGNMCCEERVKALIENKDNPYTEEDTEWLTSMNEDQFAKIEETAHKKVEENNADEEEDTQNVNNEEGGEEGGDTKVEEKKKIGIDDLDDSVKATIKRNQKLYDDSKNEVIEKIIANKKNIFTKEELQAKELDELNKIYKLAQQEEKAKGDFSGAHVGAIASYNTEEDVEPLATPSIDDFNEKDK